MTSITRRQPRRDSTILAGNLTVPDSGSDSDDKIPSPVSRVESQDVDMVAETPESPILFSTRSTSRVEETSRPVE